ncbi:hypothetical protein [uncultured Draconibacterium sp.]|uniref:hypothetical protein n=1 Tax=uncultured Draconibacterium sp. TaxID=1573823 RepID=UPI0025CEFB51|nr:hypothetical protein [uncultured Draconibacterium sp.]
MKLLPHYFKKIGIGLLLVSIILGLDGFIHGFLDGISGREYNNDFTPVFPEFFTQISDYVLLLGLLAYILAKNKTEDELAQKIRYESAFIVLVITILILIFVNMVNPNFEIKPGIFLFLEMLGYLFIRLIKRKAILGGNYEEQT